MLYSHWTLYLVPWHHFLFFFLQNLLFLSLSGRNKKLSETGFWRTHLSCSHRARSRRWINTVCLWIAWGSTELHRGLGFKLWRQKALLLTESPCVIGAVLLPMSLLVMVEIRVQAPVCMHISCFPLHCIYYYSIGQIKSNGWIQDQRSKKCTLSFNGRNLSRGKRHGHKKWCHWSWFAFSFVFLGHSTFE